jgi:hypothetical protein
VADLPFPPSEDKSQLGVSQPGGPVRHLLVQAPVPPMDVDGLNLVTIGLVVFAVASIITGLMYPQLKAAGNGWWLGVCISGFGLGLIGLGYCWNRRRLRRAGLWHRD